MKAIFPSLSWKRTVCQALFLQLQARLPFLLPRLPFARLATSTTSVQNVIWHAAAATAEGQVGAGVKDALPRPPGRISSPAKQRRGESFQLPTTTLSANLVIHTGILLVIARTANQTLLLLRRSATQHGRRETLRKRASLNK